MSTAIVEILCSAAAAVARRASRLMGQAHALGRLGLIAGWRPSSDLNRPITVGAVSVGGEADDGDRTWRLRH